ncbi:unnamed protein product [Amoebophrya sp. A25]|nr:unnamed protein product [Amoebophrya sp. A25]|eukprot:GSA25T00022715001.1
MLQQIQSTSFLEDVASGLPRSFKDVLAHVDEATKQIAGGLDEKAPIHSDVALSWPKVTPSIGTMPVGEPMGLLSAHQGGNFEHGPHSDATSTSSSAADPSSSTKSIPTYGAPSRDVALRNPIPEVEMAEGLISRIKTLAERASETMQQQLEAFGSMRATLEGHAAKNADGGGTGPGGLADKAAALAEFSRERDLIEYIDDDALVVKKEL